MIIFQVMHGASSEILIALGHRLRQARIAKRQSMAVFAERIGVGESTVRAMERGSPAVRIGAWVAAFAALGLGAKDIPSIEHGLSALGLISPEPHSPRKRASQRRGAKQRATPPSRLP